MKVVAYITQTKCVPVEVEVDDKWKPMEDYGNHVDGTTEEEDEYFDKNVNDFQEEIVETLLKTEENFCPDDLCAVWTKEDNYIFEV